MNNSKIAWQLILVFSLFQFSCHEEEKETGKKQSEPIATKKVDQVFTLLPPSTTGVDFTNVLVENNEINFFRYQYLYNGGGVAIGDINNDGLADLYFTGTLSDDKLYVNEGEMKFKDITLSAGIQQDNNLKTGVCMVDINADGWLDIYVSRSGWYEEPYKRANLLYINQGNNSFKESAKEYGLAETGNTVQVGFFDYDLDGDLDCYMANHPFHKLSSEEWFEGRENPPDRFRDKLYRNNGDNTFTEVSKSAGINNFGHGLGLAISDYNQDGWPDVYVANDFKEHDYYYINNRNGTFTERAKSMLSHVSSFSMGSDASDIDNDGQLDLFVVEMMAEDNKRQKTNMSSMDPKGFWDNVKSGYHYQFMRNTLQYNVGGGSFSEIAYLSGLATTDWSWAPLFADFDHDGLKDLAITNGYLYNTMDKDFTKKAKDFIKENGEIRYDDIIDFMESTRIKNYVYKNEGDLQFSNQSKNWGFDFAGYSNGMAYGDLDNDGDLDLVVNNFNDPASIYKNTCREQDGGNYLMVELNGTSKNKKGLGSKLWLTTNKGTQFQEFWVSRGFQSSCDQRVHFGIEADDEIKELKVEWPDGKVQSIPKPNKDRLITLNQSDAVDGEKQLPSSKRFFRRLGMGQKAIFVHKENEYDDYEKEILLPHKQSNNGPKIAVGDVNGDQLEDFYIGGAAGQAGRLVVQVQGKGFAFSSNETFEQDAKSEDIGATFFDADSDGDLDLYVVSGGNEFEPDSPLLQDRLYINNGQGGFKKTAGMLPTMHNSGGVVSAADFDGDGDQDLFVGGRIIPGKYPYSPRSYLLENEPGKFLDVTSEIAPDLVNPGLITSAVWSDFSGDGIKDLVVVGEWTGILMFENDGGEFKNVSTENGMQKETAWWNKIVAVDIDKDGDQDYVLGNLGLNYKYQASKEEPFEVYADDFDGNGSVDIVLGYYNGGKCYPVRGRQCSSEQMPIIEEQFETYEKFGDADLRGVYGDKLDDALHLKANNFASSVMLNNGNGQFELKALPMKAQFAPINGIIPSDFDKNGTIDLLMAGNLFQAEVETGRADAGRGILLLGDGKGNFEPISLKESGFIAPQDVKDIALVKRASNQPRLVLVANNNSDLQIFTEN